jgi:hypothetical protein
MMFQILNVAGGALAAAPMIKKYIPAAAAQKVGEFEMRANSYRGVFGIILMALGFIGLLQRLDIIWLGVGGSSFPQSIALFLVGLSLAPHTFEKWPAVHAYAQKIEPYTEWVGVAAIAIGLGSMIFGCIAPVCFPMYAM